MSLYGLSKYWILFIRYGTSDPKIIQYGRSKHNSCVTTISVTSLADYVIVNFFKDKDRKVVETSTSIVKKEN